MSWLRNLIGDAEHVAGAIEREAASLSGAANKKVAALEADLVKHLANAKKALGKDFVKLGLHLESRGHFNDDGSGEATIKITSTTVAVPVPEPNSSGAVPQ